MNEFNCLGAELRADREGNYSIVPHSEAAKQALKECSEYAFINPRNPVQMIELWASVINNLAMKRCRSMLKDQGWHETIGCYNANNMTCGECKERGLNDRREGCIFR